MKVEMVKNRLRLRKRNIQNKKSYRSPKSGFTLVELVVVLVILAILAAVLIPALLGYIDKARQSRALSEARSCLQTAQMFGIEAYGAGKVMPDIANNAEKEKILTEAEVPEGSDIENLQWKGESIAIIIKMVYRSSAGVKVTYENGEYKLGEDSPESTIDFGNKSTMDEISEKLKSYGQTLDSGANNIDDSQTKKFLDELKNTGINLGEDAKSWRIINGSPPYGKKIYWTEQDISTMKKDDIIPAKCYNFSTGTYTVWNMKIGQSDNNYLILQSESGKITTVPSEEQTYEQMMKDYSNAVK